MKKLFILLSIVIAFSACRKGGTGTNTGVSCWQCAIEGTYNGTQVDIDTTICNKTKAGIDDFMAPHNTTEQTVVCERMP